MSSLRLVFFGTAELACASLAALADQAGWTIAGVVTQPDRPRGRDLRLQPPPVKVLATQLGLPVWQPQRARDEGLLQTLRAAAPDLVAVAAYGQILPPPLLALPRHGCLNVHASLLPRHRGAAPIQWALLEGDAETGVTIMRMDAGLDTGDLLSQETVPIRPEDDGQTLHDRLAALGARLLVKTIPPYLAGELSPRPQPAQGATYARKITKEDGRLDWRGAAPALANRVRAFTPWPGAFTFLAGAPRPVLLKVWRAEPVAASPSRPGTVLAASKEGVLVACGAGALRLTALQREGGRRMVAAEFLAGHPLAVGQCLGEAAPPAT